MMWTCRLLGWHAPRTRTLPDGGIEKRCIDCGRIYWVSEPGAPRQLGVLGRKDRADA